MIGHIIWLLLCSAPVRGTNLLHSIVVRDSAVAQCRTQCLERSLVDHRHQDIRMLCLEDSICSLCWSECQTVDSSDDLEVALATSTWVSLKTCTLSWDIDFEPNYISIYQLYGLDLGGKWYSLNQQTFSTIDLDQHHLSKTTKIKIVKISGNATFTLDVDLSQHSYLAREGLINCQRSLPDVPVEDQPMVDKWSVFGLVFSAVFCISSLFFLMVFVLKVLCGKISSLDISVPKDVSFVTVDVSSFPWPKSEAKQRSEDPSRA